MLHIGWETLNLLKFQLKSILSEFEVLWKTWNIEHWDWILLFLSDASFFFKDYNNAIYYYESLKVQLQRNLNPSSQLKENPNFLNLFSQDITTNFNIELSCYRIRFQIASCHLLQTQLEVSISQFI